MIRDRGVALRYTHALFGAAVKRNVAEQVFEDLKSIRALNQAGGSSGLQPFLESPSVLDEHKEQIIINVLRGKVEELVVQFILLMLRKRRLGNFPLIHDQYRKLLEAKLGIARAELVTAVPVDAEMVARMRASLEALTGKKVTIDTKVNTAIIGGAVVTIDGRVLDSSTRHQLKTLREELLSAHVL